MNDLYCQDCKAAYSLNDRRWRCDCGGLLDIRFQPVFDIAKISSRFAGMWRYREALPVDDDANIISFTEGFTPLLEIEFADHPVLIKQDHLFPTGSYKDRGSSVLVSKIKEIGVEDVIEDSSGNAGASISAYCARAGISCDIYVPDSASPGKLQQIEACGGKLNLIKGDREAVARAALGAAERGYYASHVINPFFLQGVKTFAFEVCEQLGWRAPDSVVLPVGNGSLLLGAYIGFVELKQSGLIDSMPRLIAVQALNCAPIYEAFIKGFREIPLMKSQRTIAEGIAVAGPVRGRQILGVIKNTGGEVIAVGEPEITEAHKRICRRGFYIEPTSAATMAGLEKYLDRAGGDEIIVSTFTGHGLKAGQA